MTTAHPVGYLAVPATGKGPGVLVLHAWWGLNETMKALCDRLAGEGFVAFAPDLYHGKIATTIKEAEALSGSLDEGKAKTDIAEAVEFLGERADPKAQGLGVVVARRLLALSPPTIGRTAFPRSLSSTAPDLQTSRGPMRPISATLRRTTHSSRPPASRRSSRLFVRPGDRPHSTPTRARGTGSSSRIDPTPTIRTRRNWRGSGP